MCAHSCSVMRKAFARGPGWQRHWQHHKDELKKLVPPEC